MAARDRACFRWRRTAAPLSASTASTPEAEAAIRLAQQHEGIALEPTYTAKCLAALLHHGTTPGLRGRPLLFWNTFSSVDPGVAPSPPDSLPLPFRRFL